MNLCFKLQYLLASNDSKFSWPIIFTYTFKSIHQNQDAKTHFATIAGTHVLKRTKRKTTFLSAEQIFTARTRSLGQGNIFSSVCQEFCSQGICPPCRCTPPWAGTPPTPKQIPPQGRYTPARYTPGQVNHPRQVHPPGR